MLRNFNIITQETFNFMGTIPKKDRLACVGMLAANKMVYFYNGDATLAQIAEDKNELYQFFYFCIVETQKLMDEVKNILGSEFLFYWVDGIFFESPEKVNDITLLLLSKGYKSTYEVLTDFYIFENKKKHLISYLKPNAKHPKRFFIPREDLSVNKEILKALGVFSDKGVINKNLIKR